jgi:hypothetical protein
MTTEDAKTYLLTTPDVFSIERSTRKGFDWVAHVPGCYQHMTDTQLIEYATNVRQFGSTI